MFSITIKKILFNITINITKALNVSFLEIFDYTHKLPNEILIKEIIQLLEKNLDKVEDIYKITTALLK